MAKAIDCVLICCICQTKLLCNLQYLRMHLSEKGTIDHNLVMKVCEILKFIEKKKKEHNLISSVWFSLVSSYVIAISHLDTCAYMLFLSGGI